MRWDSPEVAEDFDLAVPTSHMLRSLVLNKHQHVEALEVRRGNVLGYVREGECFGESCLVAKETAAAIFRHDRNVTAVTDCELCFLRCEDVLALSKDWPELQKQIDTFAAASKELEVPRRIFNEVDTSRDGTLSPDEIGGPFSVFLTLSFCGVWLTGSLLLMALPGITSNQSQKRKCDRRFLDCL